MTTHLLAITVGPVQEFIAAARRTRDLWFGSFLLSEISKAVARSVHTQGGSLIFPNPDSLADLEPGSALNVANVILAELPGQDPRTVAEAARQAAQARWKQVADSVSQEYQALIRRDIWNDQVNDVIEFYAAWAPLGGDYRMARARVMRLLAGRKSCRDFLPARGRPGVPKSSLDGLRESVLKERREWPVRDLRRLRVREGEQLDVVGLVKRVAEGTRPYPSVARVAADAWLRGRRNSLQSVKAACQGLGNDVIRTLNLSADGHPHYADFPYEGTAVFRNRHHELVEEEGVSAELLRPLAAAVAGLGEPNPYLAIIVADGDRMGETLARLPTADDHRRFSATLSHFAAGARNIVHDHRGILVYAGGDDVLAFVPVDQCLACARKLHNSFGDLLTPESGEARITLSVGIAIGHFLENLEDLRAYGLAAEKHAKTGANRAKDALAIHLHKRGGSPIKVYGRWADDLDGRLTTLAGWLTSNQVPSRLASDLNRMADVYPRWQGDPAAAIIPDVLRVIRAKQPRAAAVELAIEVFLRSRVKDAASLRQLAEELLIARHIATVCRQATGQDSREDR